MERYQARVGGAADVTPVAARVTTVFGAKTAVGR
jgi:hypothetical protein